MTKRIAFYQMWDPDQIVDEYIFKYLEGLREVADCMVVTSNSRILPEYYQKLYEKVEYVFIRDNTGFDAGALKDSLCSFFRRDALKDFDEIIIANDSSYGPLYPLTEMFMDFEKEEVDFWSITQHPGLESIVRDRKKYSLPKHLQGYFFVIRKKAFEVMRRFFESIDYPATLWEAIWKTEIPLASTIEENGMTWKSYMALRGADTKDPKAQGITNSFELVSKYRMPFIKRRISSPVYYEEFKKTMEFLESAKLYDCEIIKRYMQRIENGKFDMFGYSAKKMKSFIDNHSRVFVYGKGEFGKNIGAFIKGRSWKFNGFIISDGEVGEDTFVFSKIELMENDGIIVGVQFDTLAYYQIMDALKSRMNPNDIMIPER